MDNTWSVIENACDQGEEIVNKVIQDNLQPLVRDLVNSAITLLKIAPLHLINSESPTIIETRRAKLLQSLKSTSSEDVVKTVDNFYQEQKQWMLDGIDLVKYTNEKLKFQHKLNLFLGQQIKTIYVYRGKKGEVVLAEIDSNQVVQEDAVRHTMRYTNKSTIMQAVDTSRKKTTTAEINESHNLKLTYRETIYRANQFKKKISLANRNHDKGEQLKRQIIIMWKSGGDWQRMTVSSMGDINEAYAAFYLNKAFQLFQQDIESNVGTFMTHPNYGVGAVDNISGLLQGDVNIGQTAYAIKSAGATVLGDVDLLNVAAALASTSPDNITQEMVKTIQSNLASMGVVRNRLYNEVNEEIDDISEELKSIFEKRASKINLKLT